jgi:hypothetical protein
MKKPGQVTWAFHGWDGGIALRFSAQSCSKRTSARDFAPPNPRMYAASLLIQAFGSQPELSKNSLDMSEPFLDWDKDSLIELFQSRKMNF